MEIMVCICMQIAYRQYTQSRRQYRKYSTAAWRINYVVQNIAIQFQQQKRIQKYNPVFGWFAHSWLRHHKNCKWKANSSSIKQGKHPSQIAYHSPNYRFSFVLVSKRQYFDFKICVHFSPLPLNHLPIQLVVPLRRLFSYFFLFLAP